MAESDSYYYSQAIEKFESAYERQNDGDLEKAIELYQESIALYPTAEAHTYLAWVYSLQGNLWQAIEECRQAIDINPDYGNPYNDMGSYYIELGKHEEALKWLQKATQAKQYDSYCYPYYNMGRIWEQKQDWEKALRCYKDALIENRDYTLAQKASNRLLAFMN